MYKADPQNNMINSVTNDTENNRINSYSGIESR